MAHIKNRLRGLLAAFVALAAALAIVRGRRSLTRSRAVTSPSPTSSLATRSICTRS